MDKKQKKEWILKNMKISSGKRITEMLKRYWGVKKKDKVKNIFGDLVEDVGRKRHDHLKS